MLNEKSPHHSSDDHIFLNAKIGSSVLRLNKKLVLVYEYSVIGEH